MYISNFAHDDDRVLNLLSNPMFLGMVNHLELFSEPSNYPDGQEWDVGLEFGV